MDLILYLLKQMGKKKEIQDTSTEEKIKEAALKVFSKKGYAAARTRDIAEEAGINLALLNYYFRSKEKLFELIMMESVQHFAASIKDILNDEKTPLEEKMTLLASHYIDRLIREPNFPLFILSEIQARPDKLIQRMGMKDALKKSVFTRQLDQMLTKQKLSINPLHFLMNFIGITVFPFIGKPLLKGVAGLSEKEFNQLMEERKKLIPLWIKTILHTN